MRYRNPLQKSRQQSLHQSVTAWGKDQTGSLNITPAFAGNPDMFQLADSSDLHFLPMHPIWPMEGLSSKQNLSAERGLGLGFGVSS